MRPELRSVDHADLACDDRLAMKRLGYVPALDGIRGVAILLVLFAHLDAHSVAGAGGATGVTVFFALSGFLITWLLCEELAAHGRVSLHSFYRRRALRLLPTLTVMLATVAVISIWDHGLVRPEELAAALFYAENWWRVAGHPDSSLSHTWSLSVEEQFYLVWPILLLALRRHRRLLFTLLAVAIYAGAVEAVSGRLSPMHLAFGTDTRGNALLIGCVAALYIFDRDRPVKVPAAAVVGSIAVIMLALLVPATVWLTLVAAATATIIVWLVDGHHEPRVLCSWPLRQTGRISYGLYVWHLPIFWLVGPHLTALPAIPRDLVLAAAAFAGALASYRWIEKPFLRRKHRERMSALLSLRVAEAA